MSETGKGDLYIRGGSGGAPASPYVKDTVVTAVEFKRAVNPRAVEMAKELLAQAEAGEIIALAYAALAPDGSSVVHASDTRGTATSQQALIGAVAILKHRLMPKD